MLLYIKEKVLAAYGLILTHKMVYECAKACCGDLKWSDRHETFSATENSLDLAL